jgi:uncharacterized RDD family membrane protein YckC
MLLFVTGSFAVVLLGAFDKWDWVPFGVLIAIIAASLFFGVYTVVSEWQIGLGKRLVGIRVVRESGARITLGQAIVRSLPVFLEVFWIDVMFALFTDKSQRAFELLSKTRVVVANGDPS